MLIDGEGNQMKYATIFSKLKLFSLIIITFPLHGCYSLDQNELCPFGIEINQEEDTRFPVFIDSNNIKISGQEQKDLIKKSRAFSAKIINETYDIAEYACTNKEIPIKMQQQIQTLADIYIKSWAMHPWTWNDNGQVQLSEIYEAYKQNNSRHIMTGTFCAVGLCSPKDHFNFCKSKKRDYLQNKEINNTLEKYYISKRNYTKTYPKMRKVSYCKGPKW